MISGHIQANYILIPNEHKQIFVQETCQHLSTGYSVSAKPFLRHHSHLLGYNLDLLWWWDMILVGQFYNFYCLTQQMFKWCIDEVHLRCVPVNNFQCPLNQDFSIFKALGYHS